MSITTKYYTSKFNKIPLWQKIIVILIGLYVLKQLLDVFKITTTIKALTNIKREFTENFDEAESGNSTSVLNCTMYYAPWCGHCKTAKPEWEKLEQSLHGKIIGGTKIVITKIDCDQYPDIAKKENIDGFPTFKFEQNGKYFDYNGGRTFDDWKKFIDNIVNK